ncbi:MAG: TlyA family RNA methyltransferase [Fusobacteriaceae bacterium]
MKERLDILLVEKGFFETREKAKRAIMAGNVIVNEKKIDKSGTFIKLDVEPNIRIKGDTCPYVSRGGYKLEKAIKVFDIDSKDKNILDIGSSTGGFTDCALQNGAQFVYAVDVGTNQLDYKLRGNPKVKSMENKHIKDLTIEDLDNNKIDLMVMDVSFISITKVIPYLIKFFHEKTELMALIKPQFEVGRENIDKGGIVRDKKNHLLAIKNIIECCKENGLNLKKIDFSPIKGGKGNVEYITLISFGSCGEEFSKEELMNIIKDGENLGGQV